MKTNHQRRFKEKRAASGKGGRGDSGNGGQGSVGRYVMYAEQRHCVLSDKTLYVAVTHADGFPHHGFARARKSAKRHLNSTERHLEKRALERNINTILGDDE